jgi:hypothetical protein
MMIYQSVIQKNYFTQQTQIVPRELEWKLVKNQIELRRQSRQIPGSIINFVGTAGIGKTTLLQQIYSENRSKEYPNLPCLKVDFDPDKDGQRYLESVEGFINLFKDWKTEINEQTQMPSSKLSKEIADFYNYLSKEKRTSKGSQRIKSSKSLDSFKNRVADAFVTYLNEITENPDKRPIVFLMDTIEKVSEDQMAWLEKYFLDPITASGLAICILASRSAVDWQMFDVKKRVIFHRLQPFNESQVAKQLPPRYRSLASDLITLSFGLPAATQALVEKIEEIQQLDHSSIDQAFLERHLQEFVQEGLLEHLLYGRIMLDVSEDLKEALLIMSPLRHFTMNVVTHILPSFISSYQSITSGIGTLVVIKDMLNTTLVEWDRKKRGYSIEEPLRRIMTLALIVKSPTRFIEVHRKAAELYATWISLDSQENRRDYIVEWLLHQAYVLRSEDATHIASNLSECLNMWIEKCYIEIEIPDLSAVDALYNHLQSDTDFQQELEGIEKGIFKKILDTFKGYRP